MIQKITKTKIKQIIKKISIILKYCFIFPPSPEQETNQYNGHYPNYKKVFSNLVICHFLGKNHPARFKNKSAILHSSWWSQKRKMTS